jgi:vancomycin resistance protein YoaR
LSAEASASPARVRRRRRSRVLHVSRSAIAAVGLIGLIAAGVGLAFAGSPAKIAGGVHIAGVDVGGLTPVEARTLLESRADSLARVPVTFVAGNDSWPVKPVQLGVEVDWAAAVEAARRQGEGFGPVRGFRRLHTRVFGADVVPPTRVYEAALDYQLDRFAKSVARAPRDAAVVLRGLRPVVVPSRVGRTLARRATERVVVRALAAFERHPTSLPIRQQLPRVTAAELAPAVAKARVALSAPVRLTDGKTTWRLPRWRLAELLALPRNGATTLAIGGPGAKRYFARLAKRVNQAPVDADFAVYSSGIEIVPSRDGYAVDVPATSRALLAAALSPTDRVARLAVETVRPERTTADARGMGITGLVGGYTTIYGGEPNRIHNVRLVATLIDKAVIAPGETFSFNATTGERNADRGFLEAPVIINGELQSGIGGGVCQVSTTVFNAAYEAGVPIESRTNHALYISHYPLGRDATVNYPDTDLRFTNDTGRWLLLRTFVGSSSLTVNLYGTPQNRRVESEASPLVVTGGPTVKRIPDNTMLAGKTMLVDAGEPSRATSVRRRVYDADGKLLYDTTWKSYYRSEPRVVRVGTKPVPKPKPTPPAKARTKDDNAPPDAAAPVPTPGAPAVTTEAPLPPLQSP